MISKPEAVTVKPSLRLPRPGLVLDKLKAMARPARPAVPPEWQEAITKSYGLRLLKPPQPMTGGIRSQSWSLETQQGKKMLKRYKGSVPHEQALHEHSVLRRLQEVDFPAPRVLPSVDGSTVVTLSDRFFGLFDFIPGAYQFNSYYHLPGQQAAFLTAVGQNLGQLHRALDGFRPEGENINGFKWETGQRGVPLGWYLEKLSRCREITAANPPDRRHPASLDLRERAAWLEQTLRADEQALDQAGLARCVIHGDYGLYNLLVMPDHRLVTLDFEMARLDWRLLDLVFAMSSATQPGPLAAQMAKMRPIVAGYQSVCPDMQSELRLIPPVWRYQFLRRVIIAWERYLDSGDEKLLGEVEHRMARVDWIERHQDELAAFGSL